MKRRMFLARAAWLSAICLVGLPLAVPVLAVPLPERAERPAQPVKALAEAPTPAKAIQNALSELQKAKNYLTRAEVEGGLSDSLDHEVNEAIVRQHYTGEVHGSMMSVTLPKKAFRFPKKGVAFLDGQWKDILSDRTTLLMDRLFPFPELILQRALTHAPKSGRWLTKEEEEKRGYESDDDDDSDDDSDDEDADEEQQKLEAAKKAEAEKARAGKTAAKAAVAAGTSAKPAGPLPRVLYVEATPKEALQHFVEVQNSNCMGGG